MTTAAAAALYINRHVAVGVPETRANRQLTRPIEISIQKDPDEIKPEDQPAAPTCCACLQELATGCEGLAAAMRIISQRGTSVQMTVSSRMQSVQVGVGLQEAFVALQQFLSLLARQTA